MQRYLPYIIIFLAFCGMLDAGYLTLEHYNTSIPPCYDTPFSDCGKVLTSKYSELFGIPVALLGLVHYFTFVITLVYAVVGKRKNAQFFALFMSTIGFIVSLYFVFIQLVILQTICLYCMLSAIISFTLFGLIQKIYGIQRRVGMMALTRFVYQGFFKKIFFTQDPEKVHDFVVRFSQIMGKVWIIRKIAALMLSYNNYALSQIVENIMFPNPVGLAAGFDYEARLIQILPSAGFGFQTIGTITKDAYAGNPKPRLGRLPKSKSLMVNKGYKNPGIQRTIETLHHLPYGYPIGISIGQTNKPMNLQESIDDICSSFTSLKKTHIANAYYELNISCPNLIDAVSFYEPAHLEKLLDAIDAIGLNKPIFVKMPITLSDKETLALLKIIARYSPAGVIFGNLQSNTNKAAFVKEEVQQFAVGKFSGKPTYKRSNELISLCYKHYKKRFVIIGCGGIFSAKDAYEKIKRGATLVQLITGMIYEGPQLIGEINYELMNLLRKDGYKKISEAIGTKQ